MDCPLSHENCGNVMGLGRQENSLVWFNMDSFGGHVAVTICVYKCFYLAIIFFLFSLLGLMVSLYFWCFICTFGIMDTVWHLCLFSHYYEISSSLRLMKYLRMRKQNMNDKQYSPLPKVHIKHPKYKDTIKTYKEVRKILWLITEINRLIVT